MAASIVCYYSQQARNHEQGMTTGSHQLNWRKKKRKKKEKEKKDKTSRLSHPSNYSKLVNTNFWMSLYR